MAYLSDNDGNSYNLCHCMDLYLLSSVELTLPKIGVISKSLTWISGVVKHIKNISNIWNRRAAFIMRSARTQFTRTSQLTSVGRDGEMHLCIALPCLYLHEKIKFIFSAI